MKRYATLEFVRPIDTVNKDFVLKVMNTIKEAINEEYKGVIKVTDISYTYDGDKLLDIIFEYTVKVKVVDETAEEKIKRLEEENAKLKKNLKHPFTDDPFGSLFGSLFKF